MTITATAGTPTDWSFYNDFDSITGAAQKSATNATSLQLANDSARPWFDRSITLTGTGLSTDAAGAVTGGTVTKLMITGIAGTPNYYTITFSTPLAAANLYNGMRQFGTGNGTAILDAIFRSAEGHSFTGGAGDDFWEGSNLADTLVGGGGDDVLIGLAGADSIVGGAGDDYIDGGNGDNTLVGGTGDDWIVGGVGNNVFTGGVGADYIYAVQGNNDTVTFAAATAAVAIDLRLGIGTAGEAAGDTYVGVEKFIGSNFNDTLLGGDGEDSLFGGKGNDLLMGRNLGDVLDGGDGIDTASYAEADIGVEILLAFNPQMGLDEGFGDILSNIEILIGSSFADTLGGADGDERIEGGADDDALLGSIGADTLNGGTGRDSVSYALSAVGVTVDLRRPGPQTGGDAAGDMLIGIEDLFGSTHDDLLIGTSGANRLDGYVGGQDTLIGGAGADTLTGGGAAPATASYETSITGIKAFLSASANNTGDAAGDLYSNVHNLIGSNFADTLVGDAVGNKLRGLSGNDVLDGLAGADELSGGAGRDRFVFGNGYGHDTITDFKAGSLGDYLDLRGVGNLVFNQSLIGAMTQQGDDVLINLTAISGVAGDSITLQHVSLGSLKPLNFIIN